MDDPETTQPGLTQGEDGTISIGPGDLKRALKDQKEAMQVEQDAINEQTEREDDPDYISGDGGSPGSLPGLDSDGRKVDTHEEAGGSQPGTPAAEDPPGKPE